MEPSRYESLARGGGTWPARVSDLPAFNAEQVRNLPTRDPHALAEKLLADTEALLATVAEFGDTPPMMNFDGDQRVRADRAIGTLLGEFIVHGRDIAGTVSADWPIDSSLVPFVFDGVNQILPGWLDSDKAAGHTAAYRVRLRGLDTTYTYAIADGHLTVNPADEVSAEVTISAEPKTWLLMSYGRINQWTPAVTGRIVVWGRKPWLAANFSKLFQAA